MNSPQEIRNLAWQRLEEADILYKNQKYDGSFYLAGYSVELMLKAKICERFGIPNLFDEGKNPDQITGLNEIRKLVKTHNLFTLLICSGLKVKFDEEKAKNINLAKANSLLFTSWNENVRYKPCGHMKNNDVETLINLLSNREGILQWIENN